MATTWTVGRRGRKETVKKKKKHPLKRKKDGEEGRIRGEGMLKWGKAGGGGREREVHKERSLNWFTKEKLKRGGGGAAQKDPQKHKP